MLWPSISRWKFQRSRIGKFAASVWCFRIVCSATSTTLAVRMPASVNNVPRCSTHSCEGSTPASQSTIRPNMAKSSASKAAITAVQSVMPRM